MTVWYIFTHANQKGRALQKTWRWKISRILTVAVQNPDSYAKLEQILVLNEITALNGQMLEILVILHENQLKILAMFGEKLNALSMEKEM